MKVSVLGAGAIGSMLGGLLQQRASQIDVVLVARGEHGRTIRDCGAVRLDGPWGRYSVPIKASPEMSDIAGSDFVLVTVKSQDLVPALSAAKPYLAGAVVISIQNGINDEALARYVAPERLVMGMTATNMAILEPGAVSLQLDGATVLGPSPEGANAAAAHAAADLLRQTGLQVDEHPNVLGVRYNKLAINALGYASCLSGSNFITQAVCHRPWRQAVGLPLVQECLAIFQHAGIALAKIPGRPDVKGLAKFLRLLDTPVLGGIVASGARQFYNRKPIVFSLYQDLMRGKPTEVDYINGHVVQLANRHGMPAACNALVVELVHELERQGAASFLSREEVIRRFSQRQSSSSFRAAATEA
jgi:2-dehydropantoate 2-reductase